ncbi:hypothetical protein Tcan_01450, partial [Toxocara canis]
MCILNHCCTEVGIHILDSLRLITSEHIIHNECEIRFSKRSNTTRKRFYIAREVISSFALILRERNVMISLSKINETKINTTKYRNNMSSGLNSVYSCHLCIHQRTLPQTLLTVVLVAIDRSRLSDASVIRIYCYFPAACFCFPVEREKVQTP